MMNKTEKEIMKNWETIDIPVVSIICMTYNHEKYIADAIESFLMQKTIFPFEIIIRDDFSMDQTATIIKKYVDKFPNIITPVFETENQYSLGKVGLPSLLKKAKGKYIALCEGDDYWTDIYKLQNQVYFLEKNDDVILVFQNAFIHEYDENNEIISTRKHNDTLRSGVVSVKQILEKKIVPTASVVYRVVPVNDFIEKYSYFPVLDTPLFMYLARYGKLYYMDQETSVYRLLMTGAVKSRLSTLETNIKFIRYYKALQKEFKEFKLDELIKQLISRRYEKIIKISFRQRSIINIIVYSVLLLVSNPIYFGPMVKRMFLKILKPSSKVRFKMFQ